MGIQLPVSFTDGFAVNALLTSFSELAYACFTDDE